MAVATTGSEFNAFSKDLGARLLEVDFASNFPVRIRSLAIAASQLDTEGDGSSIAVSWDHTYPDDYGMLDLSPSEYSALVAKITVDEKTALNYLE